MRDTSLYSAALYPTELQAREMPTCRGCASGDHCPRCRFLDGCSRECWIVSAGYRRRQAEGGYNHDLAKRGRALQGIGLSSMRFHPTGGGPEDDKDGQVAWFTARIATLIG